MAENAEGQEKSEDASGKKLSDARDQGSVIKSAELNATAILLGTIFVLLAYGSFMSEQMGQASKETMRDLDHANVTLAWVHSQLLPAFFFLSILLAPILIVILFAGVMTSIMQVGWKISTKPLMPKWDKLNPVTNFSKVIISKKSLVELIKNILKITGLTLRDLDKTSTL